MTSLEKKREKESIENVIKSSSKIISRPTFESSHGDTIIGTVETSEPLSPSEEPNPANSGVNHVCVKLIRFVIKPVIYMVRRRRENKTVRAALDRKPEGRPRVSHRERRIDEKRFRKCAERWKR
ncbi:Hypothetical protein CINCED_3A010872 [Cinara cedri]|uniref:Uncharacterized protein n=1 Tax=Cinara cedri TaxID=506608 RepID=A0A5E4MM37_9HEMI|nr:Hypothetical protein CINCED_3A010872 [Cinara cedri]